MPTFTHEGNPVDPPRKSTLKGFDPLCRAVALLRPVRNKGAKQHSRTIRTLGRRLVVPLYMACPQAHAVAPHQPEGPQQPALAVIGPFGGPSYGLAAFALES